jgi:hypothetical protein
MRMRTSLNHATWLAPWPRCNTLHSRGHLRLHLHLIQANDPKKTAYYVPTRHLPHESPNQTNAQEERAMVSRRACDAPLPEGVTETTTSADGCNICSNKGRYGRGTSVCGQCGRCHGCGSTNNGIGPLQATYFGLRSVVRKVDGQLRGGGDKGQKKDGKTVVGSTT